MKAIHLFSVPVLCCLVLFACQREPGKVSQQPAAAQGAGDQQPGKQAAGSGKVVDAEVAPFQRELLKLAFEAASKFPKFPHSKNRGRAQEVVLVGCFELGLPLLALRFAPDAEGYRRGMAYADFAYYSIQQGVTKDVRSYLELATKVADEEAAVPNMQQWRVDKIRLKVARALAALGELDEASKVADKIGASSRGAVDSNWAVTVSSRVAGMTLEQAQRDLRSITDTFSSQSLGEQYSSLMVLSGLHGRFFADEELRKELEERLLLRFFKLPANLRLDAIAPLVGHYLAEEDVDGARDIIVKMSEIVSEARWRLEDKLPELARIAELHIDTGDTDRARQELEQALAMFHEGRDDIVGIYRCEALRPIAIGFHQLGDAEQADGLLALAIEEGMQNPNSRPRCDDLVETCVAMARRRVEPSAELMARLREICDGLNAPW